ncbi:MAG: hypothetical protein QOI78_4627, partial [Actinomycetota bacterium]|nr:hypothetical protein [Actinomycetota bacterium]
TCRCIVLTRRNGRRMVLPRELLQPDALRDLTGQPAQESDTH